MGDVVVATNRLKSVVGPDSALPTEFSLTDFVITHSKLTADAMAADVTADLKVWTNPFDFAVKLVSGIVNPNAGLTAAAASARVQFKTDDGANGAPAVCLEWQTVATGSGGTGDWLTDIAEPNVGSGNNQAVSRVVPGANVWFAIAKDAGGVVVPVSFYSVRVRRID